VPSSSGLADISGTFSRLLRLDVAERRKAEVNERKLMEASIRHLERLQQHGSDTERRVACRILDNPRDCLDWEREHGHLIHRVASVRRPGLQLRAFASAACSLVHRRALFDYMSNRQLRGAARKRLVLHFHGGGYVHAMAREHGNYLRSSSSLFCVEHLVQSFHHLETFELSMQLYTDLYNEYFCAYCDAVLGLETPSDAPRPDLAQLKRRVIDRRRIMVEGSQAD
jgi:hypothetical protein